MTEFAQNIFYAFVTELFFILLSIFLREDKKKVVAVLIFGTLLSGFIGYGGLAFDKTPSNNESYEGISATPPEHMEVVVIPTETTVIFPTPTTLIAPIIFPTQELPLNITGVWDLNFTYNGYTNSNAVFTNRTSTETWSVNLRQSGTNVNGELLSVNSNYVDSCVSASIEGSVDRSNLRLFIHFNGTCCPNEIARIDGTVENDAIFTGSYQPAKTPSGTCTLSTGEVTGIKQ